MKYIQQGQTVHKVKIATFLDIYTYIYPIMGFLFHRGIHKKCCVRSQIFRYGLPEDFLSKVRKKGKGLPKELIQTDGLPTWLLEVALQLNKENCP